MNILGSKLEHTGEKKAIKTKPFTRTHLNLKNLLSLSFTWLMASASPSKQISSFAGIFKQIMLSDLLKEFSFICLFLQKTLNHSLGILTI